MLDFFKRFLPNFEKRRILSQCDNLEMNLTSILLPFLEQNNELISLSGSQESSAKTAKDFIKLVKQNSDLKRQLGNETIKHYNSVITAASRGLSDKLGILRQYVESLFQNQVATNGVNYKQLHVIKLIDMGHFFLRYSLKLLDQIVYEECVNGQISTDKPLTPAEITWLTQNMFNYVLLCKIFTEKDADFEKLIEATSEIVVVESEDTAVISGANTDPHRLGYIPVIGDIAIFFGNQLITIQYELNEANKIRAKTLQLRIELLKRKLNETTDEAARAAIEKEIAYNTKRLASLEYKINKYEEKIKGEANA